MSSLRVEKVYVRNRTINELGREVTQSTCTTVLYIDRRSVREVSRLKIHVFSLVRFRFSRRFLGAIYRVFFLLSRGLMRIAWLLLLVLANSGYQDDKY